MIHLEILCTRACRANIRPLTVPIVFLVNTYFANSFLWHVRRAETTQRLSSYIGYYIHVVKQWPGPATLREINKDVSHPKTAINYFFP